MGVQEYLVDRISSLYRGREGCKQRSPLIESGHRVYASSWTLPGTEHNNISTYGEEEDQLLE